VVTARTSQAVAAVRAAGHSSDPGDKVHEARKSLKKARSALRLLRGSVESGERASANTTLREAGRRLSGARDAEVKVETLASIADPESPSRSKSAAESWHRSLEDEADAHRGDLTIEGLADVVRQIDSVARQFRGRRPIESDGPVVANLGRAYKRGRKAMKRARKSGSPGDFHAWRKRAKDLRYQLEIVEPRLTAKFGATRERAEDLADALGDLHDLDVLAGDLSRRDLNDRDRSYFEELIAAAREEQIERCLKLGGKTYADQPGRFTKNLRQELGGDLVAP
jgi:CHAD domain-containing protein